MRPPASSSSRGQAARVEHRKARPSIDHGPRDPPRRPSSAVLRPRGVTVAVGAVLSCDFRGLRMTPKRTATLCAIRRETLLVPREPACMRLAPAAVLRYEVSSGRT